MEGWLKNLLLATSVLSCLSIVSPALAAPSTPRYSHDHLFNLSQSFTEGDKTRHKRDNVALRILSLGASIMSGTGSSTGNGCRKPLRDALRLDGYDVDMVGSRHGGTMKDYEHEAVPGDVLTQVRARVPRSTGYKPNIVIINAGTNDGNGNVDISGVGSRMNDILNDLWAADGMADTCIILSTLIPTTNANGAANRDAINSQYRSLVTQRHAGDGKCIYLADMDPGGAQWLQFDTDYLATESPHVHPNDVGHQKMAAVFYQAIHQALAANAVVAAGDFSTGPTTCDKFAGTGIDAGGLTQRGSGYDDGIYYHDSVEKGILWSADSDWDRNQWKFARLFDQRYDDLLAWITTSDTAQTYAVWANSADGKGVFTQISDLSGDLNCQYGEGVNFIDMNGDGLDDLVYIDSDGNAYLSINQGDGNRAAGKPPTFKRVSSTALIKSNEGYGRDQVVLADIDADGRGDYGIIDNSGQVYFWRNGGNTDAPEYWQALGMRFQGTVGSTRFEDINGDGRDDALNVGDSGEASTYTNSRSCATGVEGNGLNVAWRKGYYTGESSGPTHKGVGSYIIDGEHVQSRIHFARIYGTSSVFGNLPKQDYVFMQHTKLDSGKHRFQLRAWQNTGSGGTKVLADGNRYCNMVGHSSGSADYVWIYSFGRMEMWANREKGSITDSDPDGFWNYQGTIFTPPSDMDRRDLHLQDWNADGACDIIYVDPDSGAVQVWINNYPKTGTWDWTHLASPAPGLSCAQKRGHGIFDLAVRFADITGNNRADYLCIEPDGRTTGFLQQDDGSFQNADQIKVSDGYDRANFRYADVDGDGIDDLIWVEKFSGDGYVWYNNGRGDPDDLLGSSFSWRRQTEVAYSGNSAGSCEYFPDLDGNGRADEHFILGTFTNEARTALSPTCGLGDQTGDDATMSNDLPTVPGSDDGSGGDDSGDDGSGEEDWGPIGDNSDYPSRYVGSDNNCNVGVDWFAPGTDVGNTDGGNTFCMAKWRSGIFPKLLEATANDNTLCSVRVVFTDNTEMTAGKKCADDGHKRFGTLEWSPFVDTFSMFSLYDNGYKGGVGRLVAGITNANTIDAGKYYNDNTHPTQYQISRGSDGKGVLLGFSGTAGDRIDSLQPLFSSAGPADVTLLNTSYAPSIETLNTLPFDQRGMTIESATAYFDNTGASIPVEYSETLTLQYQELHKVTITDEDGREDGGEFGVSNFGFEWTMPGPVLTKISLAFTAKYVGKKVTKHVTSEENGNTKIFSTATRVRALVPAGQRIKCTVVIIQSHVNLRFSAKMVITFNDGKQYYVPVSGIYELALGSNIGDYCEDYGDDDDPDTEDDNDIISQGLYCKDGTYIGDPDLVDLTADTYAAVCPDD